MDGDGACELERDPGHKITRDETVPRCPPSYVGRDPYVVAVAHTWQDWDRGLCRDWEDGLSAAIVEGVRFLDSERNAAQEAVLERAAEERKRQAREG